ncbi:MAG: hypothetical protein OXU20_35830, partial [Myxococcales bacterium]|nr:hypothetical protein [Myxococcales bacterium]
PCEDPDHRLLARWLGPTLPSLYECVESAAFVTLEVEIEGRSGLVRIRGSSIRGAEAACVADRLRATRLPFCATEDTKEITLTVDRAVATADEPDDDAGVPLTGDEDAGVDDTNVGLLRVSTRPNAHIYASQVPLGVTPFEIPIRPGEVDLLLVNDEVGQLRARRVVLDAGRTTTVVTRLTP